MRLGEGIWAVYKPKGISSNGLLERLRRMTGIRKIGHAGTLDPLASGVLVVGIGKATAELARLVDKEKEYIATIRLGLSSTTDDEEGVKTAKEAVQPPTRGEIRAALKAFVGEIEQVPPDFSAVKVKGVEAYKLARRGKVVSLKPRKAIIKRLVIISYRWPCLKIRAVTGPGVYVRSLARDIGQSLGTLGYVADLERVRVGEFTLKNALRLDQPR